MSSYDPNKTLLESESESELTVREPAGSTPTLLESPHPGPTARPHPDPLPQEREGRVGWPEGRGEKGADNEALQMSPGSRFLNYELLRPLKVASGEADLWLMEHLDSRQRFILKLYRYGLKPKPEIIRVLQSLCRDAVAPILDHGERGGRCYEIQEFIPNGSLAELMRGNAFPPEAVKEILDELWRGLTQLHKAGILHRDIKPANILVRSLEPMDLVFTDFGISSLTDLQLHLTTTSRTAAYAAPEALTGIIARSSDWWSVGVILLELLTGRHPLEGLNERHVNFQLVTRGIAVPETLDADWRLLLRGLLTRDHAKRWESEQVEAWLKGDRNLTVHTESEGIAPGAPSHRPYKFASQEFLEPAALAGALAAHWAEAVKHCAWGFITRWVETELRHQELAARLKEVVADKQLDNDEKLTLTLLHLNPARPLVYRGQVIDGAWLQLNPELGLKFGRGPLAHWQQQLKNESWLRDWAQRGEKLRLEINALGMPVQSQIVDRLLAVPEEELLEKARALKARFAGSSEAVLRKLLEKEPLSTAEAIVLLAAESSLFLTPEQLAQQALLDQLKAWEIDLDWPLAEKLAHLNDWQFLQERWNECKALWRRRSRAFLPLSSPKLKEIVEMEQPPYLDAVAVVCNRLDFKNSLSMRFVPLFDLPLMMSVFVTRARDYETFVKATGAHWKNPEFNQSPDHPAINVSWNEAVEFCRWLTQKERQESCIGPQDEYRLPSDFEWSLAAGLQKEAGRTPLEKAGKVPGIFPWGTDWPPPADAGNFGRALGTDLMAKTVPVGRFKPNRLGLCDFGSNVMEWCFDWYDESQQTKVIRGASWFHTTAENFLSSARRTFNTSTRSDAIGFRCVLMVRSFRPPPSPNLQS